MPTAATFLFNATSRDAKGLFGIFSPFACNHVYARHGSDAGKHPDETCTAQDDDSDSQTFSVVTNEEWLDSDLTDDENKSDQVDEEVTRVDYVSTIQKAAATWILKVYVQMHCHTKRSVS